MPFIARAWSGEHGCGGAYLGCGGCTGVCMSSLRPDPTLPQPNLPFSSWPPPAASPRPPLSGRRRMCALARPPLSGSLRWRCGRSAAPTSRSRRCACLRSARRQGAAAAIVVAPLGCVRSAACVDASHGAGLAQLLLAPCSAVGVSASTRITPCPSHSTPPCPALPAGAQGGAGARERRPRPGLAIPPLCAREVRLESCCYVVPPGGSGLASQTALAFSSAAAL